jgi:hypothetical protein
MGGASAWRHTLAHCPYKRSRLVPPAELIRVSCANLYPSRKRTLRRRSACSRPHAPQASASPTWVSKGALSSKALQQRPALQPAAARLPRTHAAATPSQACQDATTVRGATWPERAAADWLQGILPRIEVIMTVRASFNSGGQGLLSLRCWARAAPAQAAKPRVQRTAHPAHARYPLRLAAPHEHETLGLGPNVWAPTAAHPPRCSMWAHASPHSYAAALRCWLYLLSEMGNAASKAACLSRHREKRSLQRGRHERVRLSVRSFLTGTALY